MNNSAIILYLFSGSHSGATIALTEGIHIIGSDESCDIILSEQNFIAKRHASLEIVVKNEVLEVFIQSLDGKIIVDNENIGNEKVSLNKSEAFYLDKACFAWNYENEEQEFINPNYLATKKNQDAIPTELSNAQDNNIGSQSSKFNELQESFTDNLELNAEQTKLEASQPSFLGKAIKYLILICLLIALTVYLKEEPESNYNYLDNFKLSVANAGLSDLNIEYVELAGKESIEIRGILYSEAQRTKLQELARALHYPVYIYVEVKEDIKSAITSSFNAIGLFPSINYTEDDSRLAINSYMKDFLVEEAAFANLYSDVAEVSKIENVNRNIVYANTLALELSSLLMQLQINNLSVMYNTGQIVISGNFVQKDIDALNKIMQNTSSKLNIPITYVLRQASLNPVESVMAQAPAEAPNSAMQKTIASLINTSATTEKPSISEKAPSQSFSNDRVLSDALGGLRITSVTSKPIPFASTVDGQKLFEGSTLPNGYIIESISTTSLTLRKDGHITTIALGS